MNVRAISCSWVSKRHYSCIYQTARFPNSSNWSSVVECRQQDFRRNRNQVKLNETEKNAHRKRCGLPFFLSRLLLKIKDIDRWSTSCKIQPNKMFLTALFVQSAVQVSFKALDMSRLWVFCLRDVSFSYHCMPGDWSMVPRDWKVSEGLKVQVLKFLPQFQLLSKSSLLPQLLTKKF